MNCFKCDFCGKVEPMKTKKTNLSLHLGVTLVNKSMPYGNVTTTGPVIKYELCDDCYDKLCTCIHDEALKHDD